MSEVYAYCDGSGSGRVCATFDYGEGYLRTYLGMCNDSVNFEFYAVLFALHKMKPGYSYILYSDHKGVVDYITLSEDFKRKSPIARHLAEKVRRVINDLNLDVTFRWASRKDNPAGWILDTPLSRSTYRRRIGKLRPEVEDWWRGPTSLSSLFEDEE